MPIDFMKKKEMLTYVGQQLDGLLHLYEGIADRGAFSVNEINSLQQKINIMLKGLKDDYGATFEMNDESEKFGNLTIMSQICTLSKAYLKAGISFLDEKNMSLNANEFQTLKEVYEKPIAYIANKLELFEKIDDGESFGLAKDLKGKMYSIITAAPLSFFAATKEEEKQTDGLASQVSGATDTTYDDKQIEGNNSTYNKHTKHRF